MLRVALTGGIASGKTVVARIFQAKGCAFQSADELAHKLMSPGRLAWRKLVAHFGESILNPDGTIDRRRLGPIVFSDPEARWFVNGVVHPLVKAAQKRTMARLERAGRFRVFVSEAALMIEAGAAHQFDKIIVVRCLPFLQVQRLMGRDGVSEEEARRRIGSQMPDDEKIMCADYVIDTSGTIAETVEQAERVYASLLLDWELKRHSDGLPSRHPKVRSRTARLTSRR